jgi:hypothetical protein
VEEENEGIPEICDCPTAKDCESGWMERGGRDNGSNKEEYHRTKKEIKSSNCLLHFLY